MGGVFKSVASGAAKPVTDKVTKGVPGASLVGGTEPGPGGSAVTGAHDAGQGDGGSWQGNTWVADPSKNTNQGGSWDGSQWSPYVSDPGVQPGQNQGQFEGLDFTKRGPAEQQWIDQGSYYNTPMFGETNTQSLVQGAQQPTQANNSQQWFDQVSGRMPTIATDPGFGTYFDNAKDRAAESINRATAATGTYGSSSANDQTSRAFTDLEGQRALKEADYNLQRLAEQRAWEGLGGSLAGQADQQTLANSQDDQNWMGLLSKLGIDASRLGLDRTNAGFDAANVAGNAERVRGRDYMSDQMGSGDRFADLIKSILGPALDNDADLLGIVNSGGVAEANARVGQEQQNAQNTVDYAKTAAGAYEYLK